MWKFSSESQIICRLDGKRNNVCFIKTDTHLLLYTVGDVHPFSVGY